MEYPFKFDFPCNTVIYGPSNSGKSTFVQKVLETPGLWEEPIQKIHYFYGIESEALNQMKKRFPDAIFIKGLPEDLESLFDPKINEVAIFDDLGAEIEQSKEFNLFLSRITHHKRVHAFVLCQFIFGPGKYRREQASNYAVIILFPCKRSIHQIQTLGRQLGIGDNKFLTQAYLDATKHPHSFLIADLRQSVPIEQRLLTNIFLENEPYAVCVYI